jgi:hypothetical protein
LLTLNQSSSTVIVTNLNAAGDLKLLAAVNTTSTTHTETLSTDGLTIQAGDATRRINNTGQSQIQTNQVTTLTSAGDIATHSGGDTLIQASTLNAQGNINLSATGYATTTNADGSTNAGRAGTITFAAVKDSTYTNVANSNNSVGWQNSNGGGNYVETLKLANISSAKGLSVNANGGVAIDIPTVQTTPAPAPQTDAKGPSTGSGQAKLIPPVALTAEQQAAQRQADFNKAIQNLSSQPGQAWIGQLANDPKVQVQWNQVQTAAQHWNYAHDGLTPEGMAIVVIAVTYCTAGVASGAAGTMTGAAAGTTTIASAAVTAGLVTLASQATVSLINNKGDIGKTLNDMGQSQNVKALVTAMVTAGALQGMDNALGIQNVNATSTFPQQLQKNLINDTAGAVVNQAINGGDLQSQLEQSIRTAFIDTSSAQSANWIGDKYQNGTLNNFTHQLAHAIAGCAAGAAKAGDCSSGALGAVVGEMSAELYGGSRTNSANLDLPGLQTDTVNFARMMAGIAVAITGGDANAINLAAAAGGNAAENNYLNHTQVAQKQKELANCTDSKCTNDVIKKYQAISDQNNLTATKDVMAADGSVMPGYLLEQEKASLTAILTGPTTCASDPSCQIEVNRSISEIQGIIDAPGDISRFFNVATGLTGLGASSALVGTGKIVTGAALGSGFDAAGQYTQLQPGDSYRPWQSLVAGVTGAFAYPMAGSSILSNVMLGGATNATNTSITNIIYGKNDSVVWAAGLGGVFGGLGAAAAYRANATLGNTIGAIPSFIPLPEAKEGAK